MKRTRLNIAISCAIMLSSGYSIANDFSVIVKKSESNYSHKPVSNLPSPDQGVPASILNKSTGDKDSGNIMKSSLNIEAENKDTITVESNVANRVTGENNINGSWSSNLSLNYIKNDSEGVEFIVPDYDGDIFLTLKITDGLYEEDMKPVIVEAENWQPTSPEYTEWEVVNIVQDWSPDLSTVLENELITQTRIVNKERERQDREERTKTGEIRDSGSPQTEYDNNVTDSREIYGSGEYWEATTDLLIQDWTIDTDYSGYVWTPDQSTRYENEAFDQTRVKRETKITQEQEIRPSTSEIRQVGSPKTEERFTNESQNVSGTMAYWKSTDPYIVQDWTVTEVFQDWNPDASTVYENTTVDQSREVKKERIIIDQEIRPATGEVRQLGSQKTDTTVVTEYRTVQGKLEYWVNTGEVSCTNWEFDRYESWIPDTSNYNRDESVVQERKKYESRECSGEQYRPETNEYRYADGEIEYRDSTENRTVYGTKIDLNNWYTNDSTSAGNWSVSNDGSYAYQSINGAPTFFDSAATTYGNTVIRGRMRVRSAAQDNDWIGMALGKQNSNTFYLWSWKNGANPNSSEKEGHNFAKVTNKAAINWNMDQSKTGYQVLQTKHGDYGWNHDNYYNFEIRYTPTNVKIYIENSKVIDVNGSFPTGQISFFNYSQGQVEYYKITEEQY